jgi:hypothetical protein
MMKTKTCKMPGCGAKNYALGFCRPHYQKDDRRRNPKKPKAKSPKELQEQARKRSEAIQLRSIKRAAAEEREKARKARSKALADERWNKTLIQERERSRKVERLKQKPDSHSEHGLGEFVEVCFDISLLTALANVDSKKLGSYFFALRADGLVNQFSYDAETKRVTVWIRREIEMAFRAGLNERPKGVMSIKPGINPGKKG